jgi:energy-coupling factor transporter ATP-binding protein EcfA2
MAGVLGGNQERTVIYELQFSHIRSYGENRNICFALPTEGKIGLTVLVGKNNAGKSTILRLLSDAFDEKPNMIFDKLDRKPHNDPEVEIKFASDGIDCQLKLTKSASAYFKKNVSKVQDGTDQSVPGVGRGGAPFVAFVPSRRPWNDSFNSETKPNLQQFENSARASRNPNHLADLGSQLNSLIASGDKEEFDSLLKAIIPEINDWTTDRISGQDKDRLNYRFGFAACEAGAVLQGRVGR